MNRSRRREFQILAALLIFAVVLILGGLISERTGWKAQAAEIYSRLGYAILVASVVRLVALMVQGPANIDVERYREFSDAGYLRIYSSFSSDNLKKVLSKAKSIRVRKTWFPEDETIEHGLVAAYRGGASIDLILADPTSTILRDRSVGAHYGSNHGASIIRQSLKRLCDNIEEFEGEDCRRLRLRTYTQWPGLPIIEFDGTLLQGAYPLGKNSMNWPWMEVDPKSSIGEVLLADLDRPAPQRDSRFLTERAGTQEIRSWLQSLPEDTPPETSSGKPTDLDRPS